MAPTQYVRLTYKPYQAKRNRTVWAMVAGKNRFWRVNVYGEQPDIPELIITGENDREVKPAIMSKKYVMLMLPDDPMLDNEYDQRRTHDLQS